MTTHTCTNCYHVSCLPINMVWEGFACVRCEHIFAKENNAIVDKGKVTHSRIDNSLKIGDSGTLDNELWTITGFSRQRVNTNPAWWGEYHLSNSKGEQTFLSCYNGHWMWAKESQEASRRFAVSNVVPLPEGEYHLYSKEHFTTVYAEGFFKYAFPEGLRTSKDYICPPYAMLLEIDEEGVHQYKASHISQKELRAAFPTIRLSGTKGINKLTSLFSSPIESLLIIFLTIAFLSVMMFWVQTPNNPIISESLRINPFNDNHIITNVFELNHNTQILSIDCSGRVTNNWVSIDATLFNIETGEEYYTNDEISYYEGIEQDERWSEGSKDAGIKFCHLAKGQYFLELRFYPSVECTFNYKVMEGGRSTWAYVIGIISLVIMGTIAMLHYVYRWQDSNIEYQIRLSIGL